MNPRLLAASVSNSVQTLAEISSESTKSVNVRPSQDPAPSPVPARAQPTRPQPPQRTVVPRALQGLPVRGKGHSRQQSSNGSRPDGIVLNRSIPTLGRPEQAERSRPACSVGRSNSPTATTDAAGRPEQCAQQSQSSFVLPDTTADKAADSMCLSTGTMRTLHAEAIPPGREARWDAWQSARNATPMATSSSQASVATSSSQASVSSAVDGSERREIAHTSAAPSSALLARMKQLKATAGQQEVSASSRNEETASRERADFLVANVVQYLSEHAASAPTSEIIAYFKPTLSDADAILLRQVGHRARFFE